MKIKTRYIVFLLSFFLVLQAYASNTQREQVKSLVKRAVTYVETQGEQKACKAFDDKHGQFVDGSLYIFAIIYKGPRAGVYVAHPYHPEFIGRNMINGKDAKGTYIIRKKIKLARKGGGWITYYWENPLVGKIQKKHVYLLPVSGTNILVASGYYSK